MQPVVDAEGKLAVVVGGGDGGGCWVKLVWVIGVEARDEW